MSDINKYNSMISENSSDEEQPRDNYSYLMGRVGNEGRYQWIIFAISMLLWIFYGIILSSISLLYLDVQFDCTAFDVAEVECEHYICSHIPP